MLSKTLFSLLILLTVELHSQQIFISRGNTEYGEPIDPFYNQQIPADLTITILLDNNGKNFEQNILFLTIEKSGDQSRAGRINEMIRPPKKNDWLIYNYRFQEEGDYEIRFTDFNRKVIASLRVTVVREKGKKIQEIKIPELLPGLEIVFCEKIFNGKPVNQQSEISLKFQNGETYIYMVNQKPLKTDLLLVNIWRKKSKGTDYEEFIDSKKYKINSSWYDAFFRYRFEKPGNYKINFFNEKEILLKTAYITVEN